MEKWALVANDIFLIGFGAWEVIKNYGITCSPQPKVVVLWILMYIFELQILTAQEVKKKKNIDWVYILWSFLASIFSPGFLGVLHYKEPSWERTVASLLEGRVPGSWSNLSGFTRHLLFLIQTSEFSVVGYITHGNSSYWRMWPRTKYQF